LGNAKLKTQVYDLQVTQSVPFIVAARFSNGAQSEPQSDVQFVCIAPNNVTAGSRTLENREPWTVAQKGSAMRSGGSSALAIGLMGATSLISML